MISLMDSLLKRESLDLHLTPYKVLPTGGDDGLVEFVPSQPLSRVIAEHRTLHRYLALTQADPSGGVGMEGRGGHGVRVRKGRRGGGLTSIWGCKGCWQVELCVYVIMKRFV
jgi:hypothetical protein